MNFQKPIFVWTKVESLTRDHNDPWNLNQISKMDFGLFQNFEMGKFKSNTFELNKSLSFCIHTFAFDKSFKRKDNMSI